MTCPTCHVEVEGLICRACFLQRARDALLREQRTYSPGVLEQRTELRLARPVRTGRFHFELFGNPNEAYCGQPLERAAQRERQFYTNTVQGTACPGCVEKFEQIAASIQQVEPGAAG